jgi:hypothetical protein
MITFADLFHCKTCREWYLRDEEGPHGNCKRFYWGVPINEDVVCPEELIAILMARELEAIISAA